MFISSLTERGSMPALIHLLSYTEQRHRMIAENIANVDTPGYRAKRLDPKAFEEALGEAMDRRGSDPRNPLTLPVHRQFEVDEFGSLRVHPTTAPARNVMFHDGTTISIDREMADLASNAMVHNAATTMLSGKFNGLMTAIRGRL